MENLFMAIASITLFTAGYLYGARQERQIWEREINDLVAELKDEYRQLKAAKTQKVTNDLIFRLDQNK